MDIIGSESVDLAFCQLKDMDHLWYKQQKDSCGMGGSLIYQDEFIGYFQDRFFPWELRKARIEEFMNMKQNLMLVKKYALKFTELTRYMLSSF